MDQGILRAVSEISYHRIADRGFHYAPANFGIQFTRDGKHMYDIHPYNEFTDSGSRMMRIENIRDDFVTQNTMNGSVLRSLQPRIREPIEIKR
jgi:hypothetical protein